MPKLSRLTPEYGNLRVSSTSDSHDDSVESDEDLGRMVNSLGISRTDYLSVIAESIGMTLKASLFDSEGRIVTASLTRGILINGNHYFWEVNSFITPKIMASWNGTSEMLLRISFGAPQLHPTFRVIPPKDPRYSHFRKYDSSFLQKVNTDPYTSRLLAQLQYGADADAQIHVLDRDKTVVFSASVHAVILSAMSSRFEKYFTASPELETNVENYSVEAVQILLQYIYGQDISPSRIDLALELISCGDKFEVKGLVDKCVEKLCSCQLNLETCIHLYEIGMGTHCLPLKDIAIKYFRRNRSSVDKFKDFKRLVRRHPRILELINA